MICLVSPSVYLKNYNVRNEKSTKEDGPWAKAHGSDCVLPQAGAILTVEEPPLCGFGPPNTVRVFEWISCFGICLGFGIWDFEFPASSR